MRVRSLFVLALTVCLAGSAVADEKADAKEAAAKKAKDKKAEARAADKKERAKKRAAARQKASAPNPFPKGAVELNDEQKAQCESLKKEYAPKFAAINKKRREVVTEDQRKAQQAAIKAAREAGKKGKEARAAIQAAVNFTPEQQSQLKDIAAEGKSLMGEYRKKAFALLTDDQKTSLRSREGRGKKKPKVKKSAE